ncbi:hypothetical protein LPJ81_002263, partial [Coemansia sp. IMI 209127]
MYYTQRTLVASDPTIHISARSSLDMNVRSFVNNSDAAASAAAAAAAPQSVRTTAPPSSSNSNISSNSGGIGAWLSRYSLRPTSNTGSRASANSTASSAASVSTINTVTSSEYARHSIDNTLANMQLTTSQQHYYPPQPQTQTQTQQQTQRQQAVAAAITNVELCEASPSASSTATAGLRKSSSRNKRHVVYRILVSGRDGQWWAMRRYSEFYDLYSILKKKVPQHTFSCTTGITAGASARLSDLFPTKRWGLPPSIEVAAQWTDRLNVFLRAITTDAEISQCEDVQRFLCDTNSALNTPTALSVIDLPLSGGGGVSSSAGASTASIMSPASALRIQLPIDNDALSSGVPGAVQTESDPRLTHDPMGRVSMPVLKDNGHSPATAAAFEVGQVMTPPTSGPKSSPGEYKTFQTAVSIPAQDGQSDCAPPTVPPRPAKHQTMEYAKSPFGTVLLDDESSLQVMRKASDSLLYLSAEKRPNMEPLTMRKKYGLRGNLQYINHGHSGDQGPDPRGDSMAIDEESEDVMMGSGTSTKDVSSGNNISMTNLSKSKDPHSSEDAVMSVRHSPTPPPRPPLHLAQQGSHLQLASLAARGNIQKAQLFHKSNVQVSGTPAMSSKGVNTLMSALVPDPQHSASPGIQQPHNNSGESSTAIFTKQTVGLDDFHLLSIIGKGSYGQVMLARYKDTGKVMAIKVISKSKLRGRPNEIRRVMSE